jgi:hypothetical protein
MNPQVFLRIALFVFTNGNVITEFVKELVGQYKNQAMAMDEGSIDVAVSEYAQKYPELAAACGHGQASTSGLRDVVRAQGLFRDLFKYVIENPETIETIFEMIERFKKYFV